MSRSKEVWQALYNEFIEIRRNGTWKNDTPGNVSAICGEVAQWVETENPFYMDHALEIVIALEAPQTETFRAELIKSMLARRSGEVKGTWSQVRRNHMKGRAFLMICNLRYHGATVAEACEKVAVWLDGHSRGEFTMKASSLERQYQDEFVKLGKEQEYQSEWVARNIAKGEPEWEAVRTALQGIRFDRSQRRGERR
jgi:hypothetical protein